MSITRYTTKGGTTWRWDCPWCKKTYRGMWSRTTCEIEERNHKKLCPKRPVKKQLMRALGKLVMSETDLARRLQLPWQRVHATMKQLLADRLVERTKRTPANVWWRKA